MASTHTAPVPRMAAMGLLAGVVAAGVLGVAPASGARAGAEKVEDYRVTLTRTPPVQVDVSELGPQDVDLVRQKCPDAFPPDSPFPKVGTPFLCSDVPIQVNDAGVRVSGRARSSQRNGAFSLTCDFVFPATTDVLVTLGEDFLPRDVQLVAIAGGGPVNCGWTIRFPDGSLSGTAGGTVSLSRIPDQQLIAADVAVTVAIVTGAGVYRAAAGGSGQYRDVYAAPFEPEAATARALAAPEDPGELHLVLGKKASGARIVAPVGTLSGGDPRRLRVVAPAGAKCSAKAGKGGKTVSLGKARVNGSTGEAVLPGTIRQKLTKTGTWQVTASCASGGDTLRTPTTKVKIT